MLTGGLRYIARNSALHLLISHWITVVHRLLRNIRARRLSLRARLRCRAAAYLGICHEAAEGALEEERGHWGRSQNQGGEDLVAVPHGECAAAIRLRGADGRSISFSGRGKTKDVAEEAALTDCIGAGAKVCPIVFSECMK